jgi:hypothetical protein
MKWKVLCALLVTYIVDVVLLKMIPFCDQLSAIHSACGI